LTNRPAEDIAAQHDYGDLDAGVSETSFLHTVFTLQPDCYSVGEYEA
jgi:hypothetical protein